MNKKYFFGWTNIKKFITEILNIYSNKNSFFSKKRIESGIAFVIGQWGMIYFLLQSISKLSAGDMAIWAAVEFSVAGYVVYQIQKEKKQTNTTDTSINTGKDETNFHTEKSNETENK